MRIVRVAATLTDAEWDRIEREFAGSSFLHAIVALRRLHNQPTSVRVVFDNGGKPCGDEEAVSKRMYMRQLPFRLVRVEEVPPGSWPERKIAIVRWTSERQLRLPLFPNMRYRHVR